ncbi:MULTISPECIES: LppU/SCO3897 family protein [unclassified Saccharothrix]|uniref:LppU/SCO3897 family protein n=1 Tax=unclassified Saccharothrix TaxID=2593673 RepID=UPI00307F0B6E
MSTDAPAPNPNYPPPPQQPPFPPQGAMQPGPMQPGAMPPGPPLPPPAPQKKKSNIAVRILTSIAGLVVAALVIYGFNYFTSDAAQTKAGDCASVTGTTTKPEYKTVACGSAEANYTVGKVLGGTGESCGSENYDQYTETARRGPDSKLCLVPIMAEGNCYQLEGSSMGYPKVDCSSSGAYKLVKKVEGSADEAACTDAAPLTYPEPKLTLCFAPGENA